MKQVIDGKLYNTETAEEVGHYDNALGCGDFRYIRESLYKTKRGRFFLAGEGGAMTKYSQGCGNNVRCEGSGIFPLGIEEAKEWMEAHGTTEEYIKAFGEPEEA